MQTPNTNGGDLLISLGRQPLRGQRGGWDCGLTAVAGLPILLSVPSDTDVGIVLRAGAIVEPEWIRDTVMLSSGPQTLAISDVYYI